MTPMPSPAWNRLPVSSKIRGRKWRLWTQFPTLSFPGSRTERHRSWLTPQVTQPRPSLQGRWCRIRDFSLARTGRGDDTLGSGRVPPSPSLQRTQAKPNRLQLRRMLPRRPHPRRIPPHRRIIRRRSKPRSRGHESAHYEAERSQSLPEVGGYGSGSSQRDKSFGGTLCP